MLCPSCHKGMHEINKDVKLHPNFQIEKWEVCYECHIGATITADFYYFEPEDETE